MKSLRKRFFLILLSLSAGTAFSQEVLVPLDHQVYPLLTKGETLGLFDSYTLRVLPLTRTDALKLLKEMHNHADELSVADNNLLDQMLGEFTDPAIGEPDAPSNEIHALRYEEGSAQFFLDLRGAQEFRLHRGRVEKPDENISETTAWGSIRGRFGDHIFFGLTARSSMIAGSKERKERFDPSKGETQVVVGKEIFKDQATGYLTVHQGPLNLFLGRTQIGWGSGLQEQFSLSTQNEPMDQVRFTLDFKQFRFSYIHANLQGIGTPRFLAGHRLDIRLGKRTQLGVYETVVYAGRGAELAYLNPFLPYHIMEHQLGDKDNNTFGIDATAILLPGIRMFTEIFVDDFSLDFPLGTYWGNKLAYMAGVHWAQPFNIKPLELFATYMRVDPFVYTHTESLNVYSHYGASIGSRLGPNAERYHLGWLLRPARDLQLEVDYDFTRKGTGDIFVSHRLEDGTAKGFLSGTLEEGHAVRFKIRYQFARDMFAGAEGTFANRDNVRTMNGVLERETMVRMYVDINY